MDEGGDGSGVALEVARETAVAADPGEAAFDDPSLGQDDEAMRLGALDDLQLPGAGLGDGGRHLRSLVRGVGDDALDEGEQTAGPPQQIEGTIAILDRGRMDHDIQKEAEGIDEDVALATRDLLARVVALRIDRGPLFAAALALWLSMTAADRLASRPSFSRTAT